MPTATLTYHFPVDDQGWVVTTGGFSGCDGAVVLGCLEGSLRTFGPSFRLPTTVTWDSLGIPHTDFVRKMRFKASWRIVGPANPADWGGAAGTWAALPSSFSLYWPNGTTPADTRLLTSSDLTNDPCNPGVNSVSPWYAMSAFVEADVCFTYPGDNPLDLDFGPLIAACNPNTGLTGTARLDDVTVEFDYGAPELTVNGLSSGATLDTCYKAGGLSPVVNLVSTVPVAWALHSGFGTVTTIDSTHATFTVYPFGPSDGVIRATRLAPLDCEFVDITVHPDPSFCTNAANRAILTHHFPVMCGPGPGLMGCNEPPRRRLR